MWNVGFTHAQDSSAWERLPKLAVDKEVSVHVDKAVTAAGIEISDWRWLKKDQAITAKVILKKELPGGVQLQFWTYTEKGYASAGGPFVDEVTPKIKKAFVGWIPIQPTERVFIYLKSRYPKTWVGLLKEPALAKEKPAKGFIDSPADFPKLWKAWSDKEKVPEIDFEKQVVLVATTTKARIHGLHLIDNKGDVQVFVGLSSFALPNECSYGFLVVDREGIKTIQGKSISVKRDIQD